jgi:phosphonate transport system substrate-binding protein
MHRRLFFTQNLLTLAAIAQLQPINAFALSQSRTFNIGVLPHISTRAMAIQYEPLRTYFSQETNVLSTVSTAPDWKSFYENTRAGQYDLVIAAAHVARLMQTELGLTPIASYYPTIKGIFIASKSKKMTSPKSARNGFIATANPASIIDFESERWLASTHQMKRGEDYQCLHVRGGDSVALSVVRDEAAAGIMCLSDLASQPEAIKDKIDVVSVFVEVPNFIALTGKVIVRKEQIWLSKNLVKFSESTALGRTFEERTGFRFGQQPLESQMKAMDIYGEKTLRLLTA